MSGNGKAVVRNIKFRDIDVEVRGGSGYMKEKEIDPRQHREWLKGVNSAFWVGNADEVHFVNLRLTWAELDAPWRHCFIVRNSTDFQVDADRLTSPCPSVATELVKRQ